MITVLTVRWPQRPPPVYLFFRMTPESCVSPEIEGRVRDKYSLRTLPLPLRYLSSVSCCRSLFRRSRTAARRTRWNARIYSRESALMFIDICFILISIYPFLLFHLFFSCSARVFFFQCFPIAVGLRSCYARYEQLAHRPRLHSRRRSPIIADVRAHTWARRTLSNEIRCIKRPEMNSSLHETGLTPRKHRLRLCRAYRASRSKSIPDERSEPSTSLSGKPIARSSGPSRRRLQRTP